MHRLVIWGSGEGTTLEYLYDQIACGQLRDYKIVGAVANEKDSPFLEKAVARQIPTLLRYQHSWEWVLRVLRDEWSPGLTILAGFMEILPKSILRLYSTINIHPSYLPEFPGKDPQKQALKAGARYTGVTIHHVTPKVDAGPIIAQYRVPILRRETLESLEWRLKLVSYRLLSKVLEENLWKGEK